MKQNIKKKNYKKKHPPIVWNWIIDRTIGLWIEKKGNRMLNESNSFALNLFAIVHPGFGVFVLYDCGQLTTNIDTNSLDSFPFS